MFGYNEGRFVDSGGAVGCNDGAIGGLGISLDIVTVGYY